MSSSKIVEQARQNGENALSPPELAAIGFARRSEDVDDQYDAAKKFVIGLQGLHRLRDISTADLHENFGLEDFEILRAKALLELGRRSAKAANGQQERISIAEDVYNQNVDLVNEKQEQFRAMLLDTKNHILQKKTIHVGTLNSSLVGPREVFRYAIREGASSLIVVHNHPSGDPTPSPEDIQITKKLSEIGELLDIPLHDHIIIGQGRYESLRRLGHI